MWALFLVFSDSESRSHRRILCSWGLGQPPPQAFSRSGYRDALLATFTIGELKEYLQNQRVRSCHNLPYEKVGKNEPACIADEVPFEIPESWEWAKIETISMPIGNKNNQIQSKEVLSTGKIPVVSQGKDLIDGYCNDVSKKIDVLPLVMFGDHTRNVKYIDFEFVIGADGTKFHKILSCNPEYIYYWMLYAAETLRNRGYARHYTLLKECFIPLPPLQEQVRIVSKIKAILPLVEKYGCEESKRVSLDSAFPNLLKKSILQEAIQGKLVPQDPADEPASILLERIRAEKEQLIKAGKIKRDKHESVIFRRDNSHYEKRGSKEVCIDDELPFDIPENWCWSRLSTLCKSISDGDHQPPPQVPSGIPFVVISNVSSGKIDLSNTRFVSHDYYENLHESRIPCRDDILFTVTGSYGIVIPVDTEDAFCFQRHIALLKPLQITTEFLSTWLNTPIVYEQCKHCATGTAQKTVGLNSLKNILIPIPPINEQVRILEQLEEVLPLIAL